MAGRRINQVASGQRVIASVQTAALFIILPLYSLAVMSPCRFHRREQEIKSQAYLWVKNSMSWFCIYFLYYIDSLYYNQFNHFFLKLTVQFY